MKLWEVGDVESFKLGVPCNTWLPSWRCPSLLRIPSVTQTVTVWMVGTWICFSTGTSTTLSIYLGGCGVAVQVVWLKLAVHGLVGFKEK